MPDTRSGAAVFFAVGETTQAAVRPVEARIFGHSR